MAIFKKEIVFHLSDMFQKVKRKSTFSQTSIVAPEIKTIMVAYGFYWLFDFI